jgi:hypothetical protein
MEFMDTTIFPDVSILWPNLLISPSPKYGSIFDPVDIEDPSRDVRTVDIKVSCGFHVCK